MYVHIVTNCFNWLGYRRQGSPSGLKWAGFGTLRLNGISVVYVVDGPHPHLLSQAGEGSRTSLSKSLAQLGRGT